MKTGLLLIAGLLAFTPTLAQANQATNAMTSSFRIGETAYPASLYPSGTNTYLILDKGGDNSDASLVLRDQGSARAEIGIVEDNDIHFKTVSGKYGSEIFTDRLLIRAQKDGIHGGEVDSFGTLLRQYATSGKPTIVVGNSDLLSGAGLELAYDQDKRRAGISSVDHEGNGYRPLVISSGGVEFYQGTNAVSKVASLSDKGLMTAPATVSGGTTFTVNGCKASTAIGGAAAGTFKSGATGKCIAVITINGATGLPAPHGWACSGNNLTNAAHAVRQTASTTTTATLAAKTAAGDVISFYCMGY
jgi:hypothetical protein